MQLRENNIEKLSQGTYDVLIVGGGINGAVSAAALAGKGARVALIDQRDFAGFTSQQTSKLIWGGIKYLESYDFRLVWKLCRSRNRLIQSYPSTVQEIRFFTSIPKNFRHSRLFLWLGAWLYWLMGRGFTKPPRLLSREDIQEEEAAIRLEHSQGGLEYSDAYLGDSDARFVFNFIRTALNRGCIAANYVESLGAERGADHLWRIRARDRVNDKTFAIQSKVLINAAGPFVDRHNALTGQETEHQHVLSKGIHLIVDRLTSHPRVLTSFASDGRLFFAIPLGKRTCIGTTDTPVDSPLVTVTEEDRRFVLDNINRLFALSRPLTPDDIIAEQCGVRPLVLEKKAKKERDWLQLSRKHVLESDSEAAHISIYGGKLTNCPIIGEEIGQLVQRWGVTLPRPAGAWFGEPAEESKKTFLHQAALMDLDSYTPAEASEKLTSRLWRRYGTEAMTLLDIIRADPGQAGILIEGTEYLRCELQQARDNEMIVQLEDLLRRRSKIALTTRREDLKQSAGLREACQILFGEQAEEKLTEYFQNRNCY